MLRQMRISSFFGIHGSFIRYNNHMTVIPIFDFDRKLRQEYQNSMAKVQGSGSPFAIAKETKTNTRKAVLTSKGKIHVTNLSSVNPVLRAIVESEYNYMRIAKVLTMEEHLKFQEMLVIDYASLTTNTINVFNNFIEHNGIAVGTSNFKKQAHVCVQRLEGVKTPEIDFAIGKDIYWPTKFHFLRPLLRGLDDPEFATSGISDQLIRTILGVSRIPEDFREVQLEHILHKSKLKASVIQEFEDYVRFRINHPTQGFPGRNDPNWCSWGTRPNARIASTGPNGLNKLQTASFEAAILMKHSLGEAFKNLCHLTNNKPFYGYVERLGMEYITKFNTQCELNKDLKPEDKPFDLIKSKTPSGMRRRERLKGKERSFLKRILSKVADKDEVSQVLKAANSGRNARKESPQSSPKKITMYSDPNLGSLRTITSVPDTGNKSRTIAICDVFTQLLLTPFEEKLIEFLDKMFGDRSAFHDHQKGFRKFQRKLVPGIKSIDFTSWTDYLPATLQKIVVKHVFNDDIAEAWYKLVVTCDWNSKSHDGPIVYGTGQGMGTKGSFIIASITDHFISELLLTKCYPDKVRTTPISNLYSRVGDDLWIWDPDDLISKHLEDSFKMKINQSKSKKATEANAVGEFVSMNINHGRNVSRVSMRNILDVRESLYDVIPLISHLKERTNIDIGILLENLKRAEFYPDKVWSNLYKGLCLEQFVGGCKPYKIQLCEHLYRLNRVHDFSVMGQEPYRDLYRHDKSDLLRLLISAYALDKDAREIKSAVLQIRKVSPETIRHWSESTVAVPRDATVWDTKLQLHELITWCQYVDSSDLQDSIDPDMLIFQIMNSENVAEAFKLLDLYKSKLIGARADLTYSSKSGIFPAQIAKVKSIEFVNISNHVVVDTAGSIPVVRILDDMIYIDEYCTSEISRELSLLGAELFLGKKDRNGAKGIPLTTSQQTVE